MLLKSLLIKTSASLRKATNFLSTDNDRNVTIIMGDNGTGKTSLAQVFTWCLYGETSFEDKYYYVKLHLHLCSLTQKKQSERTHT